MKAIAIQSIGENGGPERGLFGSIDANCHYMTDITIKM